MGTSRHDVDLQVSDRRARPDENLNVLEERAAKNARKVARTVAAGLVTSLVVVGVVVLVYRRFRRPTLAERLQGMLPDALTGLPGQVRQVAAGTAMFRLLRRNRGPMYAKE